MSGFSNSPNPSRNDICQGFRVDKGKRKMDEGWKVEKESSSDGEQRKDNPVINTIGCHCGALESFYTHFPSFLQI